MARIEDKKMQARCAETPIGLARSKGAWVAFGLLSLVGHAYEARAQPFDEIGAGLGFPGMTYLGPLIAGVSFSDTDDDGLDEFVRTGGTSGPVLYRRETRGGSFTQVTAAFPLTAQTGIDVAGHTFFDMDGDGDQDLLFLHKKKNILLENRAGVFVDATESRLPAIEGESITATAADLDGDGDLDLVVGRYLARADFPMHLCQSNLLLENDGTGRFQDVSERAGFNTVRGCTLITAVVDLDGDRQLDILVINDFGNYIDGQEVWLNTGRLTYREVAKQTGLDLPNYGMGIALGDVDGNGWLDAIVTNIGEIADMEQGPDGRFRDASARRNAIVRYAPDSNQVTWAAAYEDIDGDGNLDVVLASGFLQLFSTFVAGNPQETVILKGRGDGTFSETPLTETFPSVNHNARDLKFEDIDGDGRPEIVFAHVNNRVTAHRQRVAMPVPTTLTLVPSATGKGAAGARVVGTCGGATRSRLLMGGAFYGNSDRGVVRMTWPAPCDRVNEVAMVTVTWPSGFVSSHEVRTGAALTLEEPAWLTLSVDPGGSGLRVRVDLTAHAGVVGEPDLAGEGVVAGAMVLVEPGIWEGSIGLEPGRTEGVIDLYIDGELMGVHPKIRASDFVARPLLVPPTPIVGSSFDVWTTPGASVSLDGTLVVAGANGKATMPIQTTVGAKTLVVSRPESGAQAQWPIVVDRKASRARSELMVRDHIVKTTDVATKEVLVRVRLLNANGALANVDLSDVGLEVNGVAVQGNPARQGDWILVRVAHKDISSGATVQPTVFGERWFEPVRVAQLADVNQVGALVDPTRSKCIMNEPRLWRDGQDRGTLFANFRDSSGQKLNDFGLTPTWSTSNATMVSTSPLGVASFTGIVRAGTGDVAVGALLGSQQVPVPCRTTSVPRPPLPEPSTVLVTDLGFGTWSVGVARTFRLIPRGAEGRAIGSGVRLIVDLDQGVVQSEPDYVGLGRYETKLVPSAGPTMTLRIYTESGKLVAQQSIAVYDPNPPPVEPEPVAEVAEVVEEVAGEDTFVFADAEDAFPSADSVDGLEVGGVDAGDDTEPGPVDTATDDSGIGSEVDDASPDIGEADAGVGADAGAETNEADAGVDTNEADAGAETNEADAGADTNQADAGADTNEADAGADTNEADLVGQADGANLDAVSDEGGADTGATSSDAGLGHEDTHAADAGTGDEEVQEDAREDIRVDSSELGDASLDAVVGDTGPGVDGGEVEPEDTTSETGESDTREADTYEGDTGEADTREVDTRETDTGAEPEGEVRDAEVDVVDTSRGHEKGCEGASASAWALLALLGLTAVLRGARRPGAPHQR